MNSVIEIKSVAEWNTQLRSATASGKTVVADAKAAWCGPCKAIAPKFESLAKSFPHVVFLRFDVDDMKAIAAKYKITAMPTFLVIKAGKHVDTLKGADPTYLTELVQRNAGPNPPVAPLPVEAETAKVAGNTLFAAKIYKEAIEKYSEAITFAPTSAPLYSNRSLCYLLASNPSLALEDAKKCVELSPDWGKGYVRLGDALEANELKGEAVKAFENAVSKSEGVVKKEAEVKLLKVREKI